ncbi:hypothetical protein K501DRAFT_334901 [Backusella circina FSU 941]|nr:hypothetical protein K501DRAFT_334901 [Backusella circina FSU 941]
MYPTVALSSEDVSSGLAASPMKDAFRHSIGSQSSSATTNTTTTTTSASSRRLSVASSDISMEGDLEQQQTRLTEVEQIVNSTRSTLTSLSPSSRFLLSGATTSENFRNQVLFRFYPSSHQKALSDSSVNTSSNDLTKLISSSQESLLTFDPWCTPLQIALNKPIYSDLMDKYEQHPPFAFKKNWKRRHLVLMEHVILIYKPDRATEPAREHFILTEDTVVFATEDFKKGYVIEVRKPLSKWYIRCDTAKQMKTLLELLKKIVACIKIGYSDTLSFQVLTSFTLTDDYKILIPLKMAEEKRRHRQSLPPVITPNATLTSHLKRSNSHKPRLSLTDIPGWETTLPPAMPPPRSKPPSVPPPTLPTVSE